MMHKDTKNILSFFFLKSRFKNNSIIYNYYSDRSKREIAKTLNISSYQLDSLVYDLRCLGWLQRKGNHLEFKAVRSIVNDDNRQLVKFLLKNQYRLIKSDYSKFTDYGYYLILKLGLSKQYYTVMLDKYTKQKSASIIDALLRKADPENFEVYNSVRSIAKWWNVSKSTAQRKMQLLKNQGLIDYRENKKLIHTIALEFWNNRYLSELGNRGHLFAVWKKTHVCIYEHKGTIIECVK